MIKKLIFLLPILLFASVKISVNKKVIYPGEELIITISATGKDIQFPNISQIDGYNVIGTSVSNNITIINGEMQESISKSYIILPDKNLTIPSFTIKIDGKTYKTKPIHIIVTVPKQTKGPYELDVNVSKSTLYLGESAILTLRFKENKNADTIQIQKPQFDGFVIKLISQKTLPNGVVYKFLLLPQKVGTYKIGPLVAKVGTEIKQQLFGDPFFTVTNVKYQTIYSNTINVKVLPIPQNSVYGKFDINMKAKNKIQYTKPLKATLSIEGCGDFYDLPDFHLNIPNATVYESKPMVKTFIKNNQLCGIYTKTFTILGDGNFTIPAIFLNEFYNGKLKTISTKPINVTVIGAKPQPKQQKTTKQPIKKTQKAHNHLSTSNSSIPYKMIILIIVIFIAGLAAGAIIVYIFVKLKSKEPNIYTKIKKANQKELFNILIPYKEDPVIKDILNKIEENLYKGANHKINKKEIIKRIKKISGN